MKFFIVLATLAVAALAKPQGLKFPKRLADNVPIEFEAVPVKSSTLKNGKYVPNVYEVEQNNAARYEFSSDVEDHISDLTQKRSETREGTAVKGMYSYSDGFYFRTVNYVADENGYRVTGMEVVPLSGPQIDLAGTASVSNAAHGTHLSYKVQSVPVEGPVAKIFDQA